MPSQSLLGPEPRCPNETLLGPVPRFPSETQLGPEPRFPSETLTTEPLVHPRFFDEHLSSAVGAIDYVRGRGK